MTNMVAGWLLLFNVLIPTKGWFAPNQPILIDVKTDLPVTLVLTDFAGKIQEAKEGTAIASTKQVDLKLIFPTITTPGTYVLYAVPKDGKRADFVGTPVVIGVREDKRRGASPGPMVTHVEPLRYAVATTDKGAMSMIFYYDVAPNTSASFLSLTEQGYFDGLTFHRIVPGFVIQGGDPRGDGTGSPGYLVDAEFSDRPHEAGVLSMARNGDPNEAMGVMPRGDFANSAGSQFFVCLDYKQTQQLDKRYTVFGKVVEGMDVVNAIAATPIGDPATGRPKESQIIKSIVVKPVTSAGNPYKALLLP